MRKISGWIQPPSVSCGKRVNWRMIKISPGSNERRKEWQQQQERRQQESKSTRVIKGRRASLHFVVTEVGNRFRSRHTLTSLIAPILYPVERMNWQPSNFVLLRQEASPKLNQQIYLHRRMNCSAWNYVQPQLQPRRQQTHPHLPRRLLRSHLPLGLATV